MHKFIAWFVLSLLGSSAYSINVVDDRQISIEIKRAPMRIVTLLPSLAESVCALNAC